MSQVLSVNVSRPESVAYTDAAGGVTGIGERPVAGPVAVAAPGPRGVAGSGMAGGGVTGIGKRPVAGPVAVAAPGPRGVAGSGMAGDSVCDLRFHGGDEQAVYGCARGREEPCQAAEGPFVPARPGPTLRG